MTEVVQQHETVREGRAWPAWPEFDARTLAAVEAAIAARRWTLTWPSQGDTALERRFAETFATYNGVPYAVSVDHGSSALVVALEALDIGPGDEVIVPVMTWVASASAVLRVGALPVLVDVDPQTGCIAPDAVAAALSERTRAVMVVHLACTVAELDRLLEITTAAGAALIEDCAQAHGATWRGRAVGGHGDVGAFSFQSGKVLAGGEGGAVVTRDERLYHRAQQLRADSRMYRDGAPAPGEMEVVEVAETMGVNRCMSELHAALLLDQLERLDEQHERRERVAAELERELLALGDFAPIPVPSPAERRSIYEYGIRFFPGTFGDRTVEEVAAALERQLERPVYPPDVPLNRSVLFRPEANPRFASVWTADGRARAVGRDFEQAEAFRDTTLLIHHSALLDTDAPRDIAEALARVRR